MQCYGCLGFILLVSVSFNFQISVSCFWNLFIYPNPLALHHLICFICLIIYGQYMLDMEEVEKK